MPVVPPSVPEEFFSCDWGTTSFRLRRIDWLTGRVLAETRESSGANVLLGFGSGGGSEARERAYAQFLREKLIEMLGSDRIGGEAIPVVISGMASSSVGWREVPYAAMPFALDGSSARFLSFQMDLDKRARALIVLISGIAEEREMMRGEETEILGLFAEGKHEEVARQGLVVLPGTHSKHVRLQDRRLVRIETFMTGELFELLAHHSLLRASVTVPATQQSSDNLMTELERTAFLEGVAAAQDAGLARSLFQVRTRTVLRGIAASVNRWFLSGLLIGSEAVERTRARENIPVLLAAPPWLSGAYRLAFEMLAPEMRLFCAPAQDMILASVRGHRLLLDRWRSEGLWPG